MKTNIKKKAILKKDDWYYILPLAFIIGIVPLIVRFNYIPLEGIAKDYWTGAYDSDLYTYWKAVWIQVAAFSLILLGAVKLIKDNIKIKNTVYFIPIGIYALFIIISSVMSEHKSIAYWGYPNRYEGMFVLLSYVIILVATIILVQSEKHVKILVGSVIASSVIIGIVGILQYFGLDFMKSKEFVKEFIIPGFYYKMGEVNVSFDNIGISTTLYNSNFVGSYMAMLLPLPILLITILKKVYQKAFMGIVACLLFANLLGSRSRAGVIGGLFAVTLFIILYRSQIIRKWKYVLGIVMVGFLAVVILNTGPTDKLANQLVLIKRDFSSLLDNKENKNIIKDVTLSDNEINIVTSKNPLKVVLKNNEEIIFQDSNNNTLMQAKTKNEKGIEIKLEDKAFSDYSFELIDNNSTLAAKVLGYKLEFKFTKEGIRFVDGVGNLVTLSPVKKIEVGDKGHLGSSRVYIWSRSIPIMLETIFVGKGPSNFPISFPQKDYIGKLLNGAPKVLIDKPHNWYIETGINTGGISLIALLTLIGIYFVSSIKIYFKSKFDSFYSVTGVSIFIGVCGYLASVMFNDSVVPVAPVFWILLGLGISINYMLKKQKEESGLKIEEDKRTINIKKAKI